MDGAWSAGIEHASEIRIGGEKVVGLRGAVIGNPAGGTSIDAESRAAIDAILTAMRDHGFIN